MNVPIKPSELTPPEPAEPNPRQARLAELARLSPLDYDACREEEAKAMGVRMTTLDAEVEKARGKGQTPGGRALKDDGLCLIEDPEPWPHPVDGAALAERIRDALRAHVVFAEECHADAAALWLLGTHLMDSWALWPKVLISSPEKRCGKTTLLEAMEAFAYRPFMVSNITAAGLFRIAQASRPTLLIDEADRFLRQNEEANGIINAGHRRRTAIVVRVEERDGQQVPVPHSVWCAQVIAGIGGQADTLADRSVRIGLRRKLPGESVARLPARFFEAQADTRRMALRWAQDHAACIEGSDVAPPALGNDRAQDNWTPLYRIAVTLGGAWPERVEAAYQAMEGGEADDHDDSPGITLLRNVAEVMAASGQDQMGSSKLLEALIRLEDAPWSEWRGGNPLTGRGMAVLLKPFGIAPSRERRGSFYVRRHFEDALARYLPGGLPAIAAPTTSITSDDDDTDFSERF